MTFEEFVDQAVERVRAGKGTFTDEIINGGF